MPSEYFSDVEVSTLSREHNLCEMSEVKEQTIENKIEKNDRKTEELAESEPNENDDTIESIVTEVAESTDEDAEDDSSESSSSTCCSSDEDDRSDNEEKADDTVESSPRKEPQRDEDQSTNENRTQARRKCSFVEFCRKNKFNVQSKLQFLWNIKPADRIVCDERVLRWCGFTGPYKHVKRSFRAALSRCFPDGLFESRSDANENRRKNVVLSGHEFEFLLMNMSTDRARHTRRMFCNLKFLMQRYNAYERQWERSKRSKKLRAVLPSMPKNCPMRCSFVKNNMDDVFADILVDESGPKRYCFSLYRVDDVTELRTDTVDKRRKVKASPVVDDDENTDAEEDSAAVARVSDEKDIVKGWFVIRRRIGSYKTIEKKYTRKYPSAVRMFYCEYTDEEFNPYMLLKKQIAFRHDKCSFRYVGNVFYVYSNNDGVLPSDDDVAIMINNVFDKLRSADPNAVVILDSNKSMCVSTSDESNCVEHFDRVAKNDEEEKTVGPVDAKENSVENEEEKNEQGREEEESVDGAEEERNEDNERVSGATIEVATDATRIKMPLVRGGKNIRQNVDETTNDARDVATDTDLDDEEEDGREDLDQEMRAREETCDDEPNDASNEPDSIDDGAGHPNCDEETGARNCVVETEVEDDIKRDRDVVREEDGNNIVATVDEVPLDMNDFLISKKNVCSNDIATSRDEEEAVSTLEAFCQAAMTVCETSAVKSRTKKPRKNSTTIKNDRAENQRRKNEKSEKRKLDAVDSSLEAVAKRSSHIRSKKARSTDSHERS